MLIAESFLSGCRDLGLLYADFPSKDKSDGGMEALGNSDSLCPIQQKTHIFPSLLLAADILIEASLMPLMPFARLRCWWGSTSPTLSLLSKTLSTFLIQPLH